MPFWTLSAGCGLLLAALAVLLWRRRPPAPIWPVAFACQICALAWVFGDLWATYAPSMIQKQFALALLFTGSTGLTVGWWETARRYVVWHGLGGRALSGGAARFVPLATAGVVWLFAITNCRHGQVLTPMLGTRNVYHWGLTVLAYWSWAMIAATFTVCAWSAFRHPSRSVRRKLGWLAGATLVPMSTQLTRLVLPDALLEDPVAIGLGITSAAVLYGIRRHGLFNLPPIRVPAILRKRDALMFLDRGGRLLCWNRTAEKLLESVLLEPELRILQVLAPRLEDPVGGDRLQGSRPLSNALTRGQDVRPVFKYDGGGGERWLRFSLVPIRRSERLVAALLRIEDVTRDEHDARERFAMREPDESLALLASGVGHDFNNLLTVIEGRAQIALDDAARGLSVRRHILSIRQAAMLARDLSSELIDFAGRAAANPTPVDVSSAVAEVAELLAELLPAQVELRLELANHLLPAACDVTQLRQALMNLVKNAGEAIGDDLGVVTIRTTQRTFSRDDLNRLGLADRLAPGAHVRLEVVDSGRGMGASERAQAFEAFYSTKGAGRGLGLAVVAATVESYGGALEVDSQPGWGTTFALWLPAAPGDGAPVPVGESQGFLT